MSQKRDGTGVGSLLGSSKLTELAALTGGSSVVGSIASAPKAKARERFEGAAQSLVGHWPGDVGLCTRRAFGGDSQLLLPREHRRLSRSAPGQLLPRNETIGRSVWQVRVPGFGAVRATPR